MHAAGFSSTYLTGIARFLAGFPHVGLVPAAAVSCLGPPWTLVIVVYAVAPTAQITSLLAIFAHPILVPATAEARVRPTIATGIVVLISA